MMEHQLSRRDFLKVASLIPLYFVKSSALKPLSGLLETAEGKPNIILVLFDAMSARNLSLYGYPRRTTPNLERFAKRAIVYHSHYSAGNFTTPAVASLLTGNYPLTHRAFRLLGLVDRALQNNNLFHYLGRSHHTLAFSQNILSDLLLYQFEADIDQHLKLGKYALENDTFYDRLTKDPLLAFRSLDDLLLTKIDTPGSFFLSAFLEDSLDQISQADSLKFAELYPRGIPNNFKENLYFLIESVLDGAISVLDNLRAPSFAFFHFLFPHESYSLNGDLIYPARKEFIGMFHEGDEWKAKIEQEHFLSKGHPVEFLERKRLEYDEYLAHIDHEFGRLYDYLEQSGLLLNSLIVVTSDHGQLFERGEHGHTTPLLYEPVIRIPLLISVPGRQTTEDVYSTTSCVDLLPTLLHYIGQPVPEGCEGQILPRLGGKDQTDRSIFIDEAQNNPVRGSLNTTTLAMIKDRFKIISYRGYKGFQNEIELYDIIADPEELVNIYPSKRQLARELIQELESRLRASPYYKV